MNKLYDRIDFVNNTAPALNETNLNAMSKALDDIDDRVIDIAGDVLVVVPEILDKYADIEALATNPPYIGNNGHWWTWDTDLNQYVDSGVDAGVSVNVGTTTTLPAGSDATVTNSGTDTDPILNFGIPQGVAGQDGADGADGQDGVSPEVTITTITDGHTVTITDADHPTGQSFNVMDGTNGQGVPASGTTGQVLTKASNADYDTTWTTPSGGSGGHTILDGSGSAMTQRGKLQFDGLNVTDDSGNDKTVVTAPTPDYVDEQFDSTKTYSKGMTCISGNVRYRYKNSTATSGHRPPDTTYWEVCSVATQIKNVPLQNRTDTTDPYIIADCGNYRILQRYFHFSNQAIPQNSEKVIALTTSGWSSIAMQVLVINGWVDEKSVFYKNNQATTSGSFDSISNHRASNAHSTMGANAYIDMRIDSDYTPKIAVYQNVTGTTSSMYIWDGDVWINYIVNA